MSVILISSQRIFSRNLGRYANPVVINISDEITYKKIIKLIIYIFLMIVLIVSQYLFLYLPEYHVIILFIVVSQREQNILSFYINGAL